MRIRGALLCGLLVATAAGSAQGAGADWPGTRVRVWLHPPASAGEDAAAAPSYLRRKHIIGSIVSVQRDTVLLNEREGRPDLAVPIEAVRLFEVSAGRKSGAGKGAVIGLLSGAAAGVTTALVVCSGGECSGSGGDYTGFVAAVFGLGGVLFGAGIGALIGSRIHSDRWEEVPITNLRVGMNPSGDASLRVSMAFP